MRRKANFLNTLNVDPVQSSREKYFFFRFSEVRVFLSPSRLIDEGRIAISAKRGAGCSGRDDVECA
jgi:hypothetical protein